MATIVPPNADVPVWTGGTYARWVAGRMLYSNGAAAGVHTVAIYLPPGALLLNVGVVGVALWNQGTSAGMIVGDANVTNGFFTTIDLKATALLAGEAVFCGYGTGMAGGVIGGYVANSQWAVASTQSGIYTTTSRVITFTNTTVGTAATTGESICLVNYLSFSGSEPVVAGTYVAT